MLRSFLGIEAYIFLSSCVLLFCFIFEDLDMNMDLYLGLAPALDLGRDLDLILALDLIWWFEFCREFPILLLVRSHHLYLGVLCKCKWRRMCCRFQIQDSG